MVLFVQFVYIFPELHQSSFILLHSQLLCTPKNDSVHFFLVFLISLVCFLKLFFIKSISPLPANHDNSCF